MARFLTRWGGAVWWLPLVAGLTATLEAQRAPERDRAAAAASQSSRWWMGPQVRGVVTDVSHPLIGRPLFGASVGLTLARPAGHVAWTVRTEFLNGEAERFGVVCAGFVPPGSCDQREAIADDTRLTTGRVGLAVAVVRHPRVRLDGYSPFAESFGARSLRLGAVWWLPIPVR